MSRMKCHLPIKRETGEKSCIALHTGSLKSRLPSDFETITMNEYFLFHLSIFNETQALAGSPSQGPSLSPPFSFCFEAAWYPLSHSHLNLPDLLCMEGVKGERHRPQRPSDRCATEVTKCHKYFLSKVMEVVETADQGQPSCLGLEGSTPHRRDDIQPNSFGISSNGFGSRHLFCRFLHFTLSGSSLNKFFSLPLCPES